MLSWLIDLIEAYDDLNSYDFLVVRHFKMSCLYELSVVQFYLTNHLLICLRVKLKCCIFVLNNKIRLFD